LGKSNGQLWGERGASRIRVRGDQNLGELIAYIAKRRKLKKGGPRHKCSDQDWDNKKGFPPVEGWPVKGPESRLATPTTEV